jgi:hypothetical protein
MRDACHLPLTTCYFSNRKTFCAMALIADEAIANLTAVIESTLGSDGRDILIVMAGDNGGMPGAVRAACCVCALLVCATCAAQASHI